MLKRQNVGCIYPGIAHFLQHCLMELWNVIVVLQVLLKLNAHLITGTVNSSPVFYLVPCEDELKLNKKQQYYYQVQAQLGVTKFKSTYFVVYTEKDLYYEKIELDYELRDDMCNNGAVMALDSSPKSF